MIRWRDIRLFVLCRVLGAFANNYEFLEATLDYVAETAPLPRDIVYYAHGGKENIKHPC